MFSRKCPSCSQAIPFKHIAQYLEQDALQCPYCLQHLKIKTLDSIVNSLLVGALAGIIGAALELPLGWIVTIGALSAIFLQKYVDVFFSLTLDE
jgi:ABC-type Fe3+ transport system permease subunit